MTESQQARLLIDPETCDVYQVVRGPRVARATRHAPPRLRHNRLTLGAFRSSRVAPFLFMLFMQ